MSNSEPLAAAFPIRDRLLNRTDHGHHLNSSTVTASSPLNTDFIRPGEEPPRRTRPTLRADLAPEGILEHNLVDEIRRGYVASPPLWPRRTESCSHGRRSHAHEPPNSSFASTVPAPFSHRFLHKCTSELRKLQTERLLRNESSTPHKRSGPISARVSDIRAVRKGVREHLTATRQRRKRNADAVLDAIMQMPCPSSDGPSPAESGSFCKNGSEPSQTPRNASCPCGSGQKHKRCCGKDAPAVLHAA